MEIKQVCGKDILQSIPGIVNVFRDDEVVPWHRYDECLAWVTRRAERGFYMTAAVDGDTIVGYSEWIETFDNGAKILYLGLMQVDCDLRGRGIGGAMLADGISYAKRIGASKLRTLPEDERSHNFYRKYGFTETDEIYYCVCPTIETAYCEKSNEVTLEVVNTHEFVFGVCQSSGRHMYECANHNPETSGYTAKTAYIESGYLQFRYKIGSKEAHVLYWSNKPVTAETVSAILEQGYAHGFDEIKFYFKSKYLDLFRDYSVIRESIEIEKELI